MKTWKEIRETLPEGLTEETMEVARRAGARRRQEQRREETIAAALKEADAALIRLAAEPVLLKRPHPNDSYKSRHSLVRRIATLLLSISMQSRKSQRPQWAAHLGTGRWQAMDGGAWRDAAQKAIEHMGESHWAITQGVDDLRFVDFLVEEGMDYEDEEGNTIPANGADTDDMVAFVTALLDFDRAQILEVAERAIQDGMRHMSRYPEMGSATMLRADALMDFCHVRDDGDRPSVGAWSEVEWEICSKHFDGPLLGGYTINGAWLCAVLRDGRMGVEGFVYPLQDWEDRFDKIALRMRLSTRDRAGFRAVLERVRAGEVETLRPAAEEASAG